MIIWLASYPRSGNTFLRVILNSVFGIKTYSIYNDSGDIGADEKTSEVVGHELLPEDFNIEKARKSDKLYIIKTHQYPPNDIDKAIYLIRDGRESSLSFVKHQNRFSYKQKKLIDIIYGNTYVGNWNIGTWGEHVNAWDPNKRDNTLLVKFEELIDSPTHYISVISEFIGKNPIAEKIPTFEELHEINPKFFRSGKKDSWKEEYTENDQLAFWFKNYSQMIAYGYGNDMPEVFHKPEDITLLKGLSNENAYLLNVIANNYKELQKVKESQIERLQEKEQVIAQKNRELEAKENQLQKCKETIENHSKDFQEQERIIAQKSQELEAKEKQLQKNKETIEFNSKDLQEQKRIIAQKSQELEVKEKQLLKNKEMIEINSKDLQEQERVITQKNQELETKEKQLQEKHKVIEESKALMLSIEEFTHISAIRQPVKKYKAGNSIVVEYKKYRIINPSEDKAKK